MSPCAQFILVLSSNHISPGLANITLVVVNAKTTFVFSVLSRFFVFEVLSSLGRSRNTVIL